MQVPSAGVHDEQECASLDSFNEGAGPLQTTSLEARAALQTDVQRVECEFGDRSLCAYAIDP